ncbi:DUF4262 domain-containing protein [Streptosporangium sp. NBC_01755]|uniref:DUF4262 domain-containing protein n=1 Tax=unclassified Streptosporangium TaxID=2632669 RepID=UPI002DDAA28B|nr:MULTISPECIES: DUF4262 domain-containing protein [unclassified Streptosporangium]WSA25869.1 DUF4262 domain-containing protein [Streptosporangium sp. NBC_01810]WSD02738.1 DUF4262 domain-containing protein [Streptosporangium sp. NBC_01755]
MSDQPVCHCLLCVEQEVELDEADLAMLRSVRNRGWAVVMIPEDEDGPGWAFTVGLWHTLRSPEVVMLGLRVDVMGNCLNTLADQIAAGHHLVEGRERDDVIRNYPVVAKTVDTSWYRSLFGTALHFYQRPPLPFMEIVWPDAAGRFPWNDGCAPRLRELQPALWIPKDDHAPGPWTKLP